MDSDIIVNGIKYKDINSVIDKSIEDLNYQVRFLNIIKKLDLQNKTPDALDKLETIQSNLERFDNPSSPEQSRRQFIKDIK